mmetsp:Transcript_14260/g.51292  ORF Transcript_14260/g.51292 Transcript_14260/m.51292 type:complete len:220 (+) Transcript_14260:2326-2985(+)
MIAAPCAATRLISSTTLGFGFPTATSFARSAHSRTRMRSTSIRSSSLARTHIPVALSCRLHSMFRGASALSAATASSAHVVASVVADSNASISSHRHGSSAPCSRSFFASSSSHDGVVAIRLVALAAQAFVSSTAASSDATSLGCTGRCALLALSASKSSVVGRSARAGRCLRPGSALRCASAHACAAATASLILRADVTSKGPRATSARSAANFFGFG